MEKSDWFAAIIAILGVGGGLYVSNFQRAIIRRSGLTLIAVGAFALTFWFGHYYSAREFGHILHPGYPLRVTTPDSN